jgi:hypothetical protein
VRRSPSYSRRPAGREARRKTRGKTGTRGEDPDEVNFRGPENRRRGSREHRYCPCCFRSSPVRTGRTLGSSRKP